MQAAATVPVSIPANLRVSENAEILLEAIVNRELESIDAELWADELWELLDKNLITLTGKLDRAQVETTRFGRAYAQGAPTSASALAANEVEA